MTVRRLYSIVVPVYNNAAGLPALADELGRCMPALNLPFETILVNDGSRDASWDVICQLSTQHRWLRGINLMRNYGQHNALLCGIREARGDVIITMDDDLQNPPAEVPKLLARLEEGFDVVYGTPQREQHGFFRDMASRITKMALQGAMGAETARNVSAFRALRADLRNAFADYRGPYVSIDVLLTWATTRFSAVPVQHDPRRIGKSNYTLAKLITHAMNMVTGFSTLPLRLASIIGFSFTVFGMLVLIYVIGRYVVLGYSVPGFPFLASIVAIFSGAQLFALGIIGEYLSRMHLRLMDRPSYTVQQCISGGGR